MRTSGHLWYKPGSRSHRSSRSPGRRERPMR